LSSARERKKNGREEDSGSLRGGEWGGGEGKVLGGTCGFGWGTGKKYAKLSEL